MRFALLGPPNSGKKTFFSLLTARAQDVADSPVTIHGLMKLKGVRREGDALVGSAPIQDERLIALSRMFKPERLVFAENAIVLCPDIVPGSSDRKWLEPARRSDLLCVLLRGFEPGGGIRSVGSTEMSRQKSAIESELLLADLEVIENRLNRLEKEIRGARSSALEFEQGALLRIKEKLESEMSLCAPSLDPRDIEPVKSLGLLSAKPVLWAHNVDEKSLGGDSDAEAGAFRVSCRIEQEIMALGNPDEQAAYLRDLGVEESGLDRLNRAAYNALGLISFYTVGDDEVRAWTIRKGSLAPVAAGKVHSDFQRGFIRVEIVKCRDLLEAGSEAAAKAAGKQQTKGKDYVIEDGDVCHFLFNV